MEKIKGGLETVKGYSFSSLECGIRYDNRLDYTIISADNFCNAAGVFTTNKIYAAPVKICRERINNSIKAIIINSTNANACTGSKGYENAAAITRDISEKLDVKPENILMASTGIIGRQLPLEKMIKSHNRLIKGLSSANGDSVARAIMTTDTVPKYCAVKFTCAQKEYTMAGVAKGSGMIAPDMATLLSFIITDAPVSKEDLNRIFKEKIETTYNSITIDGDTSTNDTAIILAPISDEPLKNDSDIKNFSQALEFLLSDLAEKLMFDGEGVSKVVKINVSSARNKKDANLIAKSVSRSLLVKTAIFGNDPNWGRIACAAGYSGAEIEEDLLTIMIEDKALFKKGETLDVNYTDLEEILKRNSYSINIDIGLGSGHSSIFTSDLSYEYVKINAEYST
ncbi:MAG: bifunctional glutamate N-acetyltransferase/amino-acid acetyltransferase ArgJ [Spirochaetota bacterium]